MEEYKVFYFESHNEKTETENNIIVLYDEIEGNFYYYGSKNDRKELKIMNYSGKFYYTRINELNHMLYMIFDSYYSQMKTELHNLEIKTSEYNKINYKYLKQKMSKKTMMSTFCNNLEAYEMQNYLQTLITHEV